MRLHRLLSTFLKFPFYYHLWAAVLSTALFCGAAQAQAGDEQRSLALELLRELVEINTTDAQGDNTAAAEAMAARLIAAGFEQRDVQVLAPAPRKGNLVARYQGKNDALPPILLMAHLDVVEALPEDWTVPPFTLLEKDGYYWGRGTTDDKAMAAIFVANLIRLKKEGHIPRRDIILALTADEEGGDHNGVQWLLAEHKGLIDAAFAINEGGGGAIVNGKHLYNSVQASEKVYQSYKLEVTNAGGHSSLPRQDNAINQLVRGLLAISEFEFPVALNEVTTAYFERSAEIETGELAQDMKSVLSGKPTPASLTRLAELPHLNARLRTTCIATQLAAGHAENALPQRATATVNCRILPGHDPNEVKGTLEQLVGDPAISITPVLEPRPSPPSPLTPEIMSVIEEITEQMWPGVPVIPIMSTGATDGLYLRRAGIPVYGVSGIFGDVDDVRAHGRDERIKADSYYDGLEFLYRLVKQLS